MPGITWAISNATHPVDPDTFRAVISKYGDLAKQCLFMVRINRATLPSGELADLSFLCEQAEMPGRNIETMEYRTGGSTYRTPFISVYNDITLTFVVRDNMAEKDFFDAWMQIINPVEFYDFNYRDEYRSTIDIYQYAADGTSRNTLRATYQMRLIDAYPVSILPLPLAWGEEGFHRLAVQFTCSQFARPWDLVRHSSAASKLITDINAQVTTTGGKILVPAI
jgi:hypothetical protein